MNKLLIGLIFIVMNHSSFVYGTELNSDQQAEITKQSSLVVTKIFEAANNKQFLKGLDYYSNDKNALFVSDGIIHTLADLKQSYENVGSTVEYLHNEILEWKVNVLSEDLVAFTLPVQLTLKFKGIPEYTGQIIWTALLQKQNNNWLVIQSHESWTNYAEVLKALTPN